MIDTRYPTESKYQIMIYLIFDLVNNYLIEKNDFPNVKKMKEVSKESKQTIDKNYLLKKKLSIIKLANVIQRINLTPYEIEEYMTNRKDYKYIFSLIYGFSFDINYDNRVFINDINNYQTDRLNPFKNLPIFTHKKISKQIKNSLSLSLALNHAEKPSITKRLKHIYYYD